MLQGLDTALAALFITFGTPLVGFIPVLIGWGRIESQRNSMGQRTFPKALWTLAASICIGPIGLFVLRTVWSVGERMGKPAGVYTLPPQLLIVLLGVGFILNVIALVIALFEKNAARAAVLAGSIAVAAVNGVGFAWLFSTSEGISMWTK